MSETDTTDLDNRMNGEKPPTSLTNFMKASFATLIMILGYFFAGTVLLYGCRISQSCLLPNNSEMYPYTDKKPEETRQFWTNVFYSDEGTHHISFEPGAYKLIPTLVKYRDSINIRFVHFVLTNIISVLEFTYSTMDTVMKSVNSTCSENVIILLSPFIFGFLSIILFFGNTGYLIYLWFKNLNIFFMEGAKNDGDTSGKLVWEEISSLSLFSRIGAWCWCIAMIIIFFFVYPLLSLSASIYMPIAMLTIMSYGSVYHDGTQLIKTNIVDVFRMVLKYYKSIVLVLIGYGTAAAASTHLGASVGGAFFGMINLIIVLGYFGVITTFNSVPLENLQEPMDFDPAFEMVDVQKGGGLTLRSQNLKNMLKKIGKTT